MSDVVKFSRSTPAWHPKAGHTVYRAFDADDRLLYVGCTARPLDRITKQAESEWWASAAFMTFQHFGDRRAALDAERDAIEQEDPIYNVRRPGYSYVVAEQFREQARQRAANLRDEAS